jgi:hypothetical protein
VRRLASASSVLVAALVAATAAVSAPDPRDEQRRISRADQALARASLLKRTDLKSGWRKVTDRPDNSDDTTCPGYNPDMSSFTISGEAQSHFAQPASGSIDAFVEVYATEGDARGDFRAGAKPALARCLRKVITDEMKSDASGVEGTVLSSRMLRAPNICGCTGTAAFRLVTQVQAGTRRVRVYMDLLVFQKGRAIEGLVITTGLAPLRDRAVLAQLMADRMR